jgi:hypothetical protein
LELAFETKELRDVCGDEDIANREYGLVVAQSLKSRVADLRATKTLAEMDAIAPILQLDGEMKMSIDLSDGFSLVFTPNHVKTPKDDSGHLVLNAIRRVKILGVHSND